MVKKKLSGGENIPTNKMEQNQTIYNFTLEPDGTWTMVGVWVIDDFPREERRAQSQKFHVNNNQYMYLRFLNYLNRIGTQISVIVFFNCLSQEYPMDLTLRLLNSDPSKNQEKTTHVVYSGTALRSYVDFKAKWSDLTEGSGFIDQQTGRLRIEFRFRHTLRPFETPLQSFNASPVVAQLARPRPIDDAFSKYGVVGIITRGGDECLNAVTLSLYNIPYFRSLVYSINTVGFEGTQNRTLPLQKLFAALQTGKQAVSSTEFVLISNWQPEHVAMTHLSEAFTTVLSAVRDQIDKTEFNQLFKIGMKRVVRCPEIKYESIKEHAVDALELKIDAKKPQTFMELLQNFNSDPEKIDEYIVKGSGAHTAYLSNEIDSFSYVVFVILERFSIDITESTCRKIVSDLKVPESVDFNKALLPEKRPSNEADMQIWDLQAVLVHSGSSDNGRFHANIKRGPESDKWLEYRSYEVCEVPASTAINSTDSIGLLYTLRSKASLLFKACDPNIIPPHVYDPLPLPAEPPHMVTVVTEEDYRQATLRGEVGCGLIGTRVYPAQRNGTVERFAEIVASHLKISRRERILLWQVSNEGTLISPLDPQTMIEAVIDTQRPVLFLQISKSENKTYILKENELMIFIKFYWENAPYPLQFICSDIVVKSDPICSLYGTISSILKVPETIPLIPLVERNDYSAVLLNQSSSFESEKIINGTTIIFECPIEIPEFNPQFNFGKALPPVRQAPQFPQYIGQDISDDVLFVDLTIEHDDNGIENQIIPKSAELFYDIRYHLAVVGVTICGSNEPPQSFFRIPLSYPIDELEHRISYDLGMAQKLTFYEPTDDGIQSDKVLDRNVYTSLKPFLTNLPSATRRPITLYVQEVNENC